MSHLKNLQAAMKRDGMEAVLVTSEVSQRYLSGLNYTDGYVLVLPEKAFLMADFRYIEDARSIVDANDFEVVMPEGGVVRYTSGLLAEQGVKVLHFEEATMSYGLLETLKKTFEGVELLPGASAILDGLREFKDAGEIEKMTRAQQITDAAFAHILNFINPDRTEVEVALELEFFMRSKGAESTAFQTIAVSGSASSLPHGVPRPVKLERGFFTMDYGAKVGGYCSDMTRTVVIGKADDEMKKLYNTVLSAQKAALDMLREGVTGVAADKVARDIIDNAGYRGCFGHGLGHGVGRYIHENPRLSFAAGETPLVRGNIVTVEPGIYLAGKYGCRIEDMVAITENGIQNFTKSPKELIELY